MDKSKKSADFGRRPRKLASNFTMIITKMRKKLKSKKFMTIFTKIWTEERKLS